MDYTINIMLDEGYYDFKIIDYKKSLKYAQWIILNPIIIQDFDAIKIY